MDEIPGTCLICKKQTDDATDGYVNDTGDLQGVCDSCRADASLGQAVRRIPIRTQINRDVEKWWIWRHGMKSLGVHDTVEAALAAAGLMEGEGEC